MQEKVRTYIKDYYKDKEINKSELLKINSTTFVIKEKIVNLADLLIFCTSYLPEESKLSERLYNIISNIYNRPICPVCNINNCNFKNYFNGYNNTCSSKCAKYSNEYIKKHEDTCLKKYGVKTPLQSKEIREKSKQTLLTNYGVENAFQNKEIQEKQKQTLIERYGVENYTHTDEYKEKCKKTCLEKYGTIHHTHTNDYKENTRLNCLEKYNTESFMQSEEFKEKSKLTCIEKYGTEYYTQTEEYKEKSKQTCLNNYGVEFPMQSNIIKEKSKITCLNRYGVDNPTKSKEIQDKIKTNKFNLLLSDNKRLNNCTPLFDLEEFKQNKINTNYKWKWKCNICNTIFYDDLEDGSSPVCHKCYKRYGSNLQKEVYEFLQTYNLDIRLNDRRFKFEIDILLENYNLGIEVNGNYWHSDLRGKDKFYHFNKSLECAKNNISLIHIFEDDWLYKKDIVKNIILSKLNLIDNNISNLDIYKITDEMSAEFLNNNCIHGNIKDNNIKHYGLCTQEDIYYLISVDISNNKIVRYCSKLNYKINIDDISKLISHICKEYNLTNLIVYCDLRYDTGDLFKDLNFTFTKYKYPTYDYVNITEYNTRIDKENLIFENYDDKLSIWYNAMNNNYDRIWNCGYLIYNRSLLC